MADFPSNVTTETSTNAQSSQQGGNTLRGLATQVSSGMDMSFVRSIPAMLMIAEIVLGLLHWALIASTLYTVIPAYGWVMFVAVTSWLFTLILFILILYRVQRRLPSVPWTLVVMVYHGVVTVLYLIAFITNAACVYHGFYYGHLAAAAFFAAVVTIAYGVSAFFAYLDWRGDGGNAATNTVPT
ncbi:plasmolipin [Periophthalmus magnuspinnatus]|uniref:plasmolipin n=1 Tax=Periophthalmus magnuspinnatus TaxID=409849 RepID=UPI00145A7EFB|nr:plasmolipin [Periophthalmus magnuspinnatus]